MSSYSFASPRRGHRKRRHQPTGDPRAPLLEQLEEVARRIGLEVREERLLREVGYSVRSGGCRVAGRDVVFLDTNAPIEQRIEVLVDLLAQRDLEEIYLEPELREMIGRRALAYEESSKRADSA